MRIWILAAIGVFIAASGARAQGAGSCDPAVDYSSPAAMIDALKPKTAEQVEACRSRGIRLSTPGTTAPNAAAPVMSTASPPPPAASQNNRLAVLALSVPFPTGSADLTPASRQILDRVADALNSGDLKTFRFRIEGHTDTVGTAEFNRTLSKQRAESVRHYLETVRGVEASRLDDVGLGFDQPLVATPPGTAEARNRRVEVVNIGR